VSTDSAEDLDGIDRYRDGQVWVIDRVRWLHDAAQETATAHQTSN
jgi:hypothetical protein